MIHSPRLSTFLAGVLFLLPAIAWGQLRIVSYNTATSGQNDAPGTPRAGMDVVLEAIGSEVRQGISKPIDVLLLQEVQTSSITSQAFVNLLNDIYGPNVYARSTLNPPTSGGGRVGMVYNTQTVQLVGQTSLGNASPRDTGRYQLRPVGYGADADFFVYNDHYKAGDDASDRSTRANHATTVRNNANSLGQGAHIIYAGDFNIQSSSETMYQNLLAGGAGQAFDPINRPGTWHNSSSHRVTHTQSPYDPSVGDPTLISGGLDDRFDFQLASGEMIDDEGVAYIGGTYHAFGNNGSHGLNDSVNDPSNNAQPANVLDALASVSDHLPVVADYQVPAVMQISGDSFVGRAIQGSFAFAAIEVWNAATVVSPNGADELDYTVVGSGGLTGSFDDTDDALGDANIHAFVLDTSTFGMGAGSVQATTSSPQAVNPTLGLTVNYEIVDHSNASLSATMDVNSAFVDLGIVAPGSQSQAMLNVHNLASALPMAALDLFNFTQESDTDKITTDLIPFANLESGQAMPFTVTLDTSESGSFASLFTMLLGDEDIQGGLAAQSLILGVTGSVALPGDANLDGTVDGQDFIIWNGHKFSSGNDWASADFNGDGITDGQDFIIWNDHKFTSLDIVAVPEPRVAVGAIAFIALSGFPIRSRRRNSSAERQEPHRKCL